MTDFTLAMDVGTTSVRAIVMAADGSVVAGSRAAAAVTAPRPGWLEQDANVLYEEITRVAGNALSTANLSHSDVAAIGITTSRANIVIWDPASGAAVAPMVSWQDLRGSARAAELQAQGFMVTHQTAASKLESVLADIDDGLARLNAGSLKWGNIDTYVAWRLSNGAIYAMDESQACATGYYDYFTGGWNANLLALQSIDAAVLPSLTDTFSTFGAWHDVPVAALIADQQSAALAQGCIEPGIGKVTFGTSATFDVHTGSALLLAAGAYPLVHWRTGEDRRYCVEGMVNTAGAFLDWCAGMLGVADAVALGDLAASTTSSNGVAILPALQGLGTPHADPSATGKLLGLTRATTRSDIARAAFEAIAFRIREVDEAIYALPELERGPSLRVDGGASQSDVLLQLQADVLGQPIERLAHVEATALGAALAAGIGVGAWQLNDIGAKRRAERVFMPQWSRDERDSRFDAWRSAALQHR